MNGPKVSLEPPRIDVRLPEELSEALRQFAQAVPELARAAEGALEAARKIKEGMA